MSILHQIDHQHHQLQLTSIIFSCFLCSVAESRELPSSTCNCNVAYSVGTSLFCRGFFPPVTVTVAYVGIPRDCTNSTTLQSINL